MGLEQNRAVSFTCLGVYVSLRVQFPPSSSSRMRSALTRVDGVRSLPEIRARVDRVLPPFWRKKSLSHWEQEGARLATSEEENSFFIQFSFRLHLLETVEFFEKNCARRSKLQNLKWKEVYGKGEDTLLGIIRLSKKKCPEWPWI